MYNIIFKFIIVTTVLSLGLSFKDVFEKPEYAKRKVLKMEWKPISIFPEEAKRFR